MELVLYILLGLIAGFLVFYLLPNFVISLIMYRILLVRTNKEKWSRNVSWDDDEQRRMFAVGEAWGKENESFRTRVTIKSQKFNLVGEYFDFGFDKAVIIVPGRMETCVYSYFFAKPYKESGYNVLAIDNRAHGLSDGRYNTVGLKEYEDILAWAKYLHDDLDNKKIWCHGICIGAATCLNAFTADCAPDYLQGLIAEGMYIHFGDMLCRQIKTRGHAPHPSTEIVLFLMTLTAGANPVKNGPISRLSRMFKPMLFIYGEKDVLSDPDNCRALYEKCNGKKRLVWMKEGVHSHLRINGEEIYDGAIKDFLKENQND